MSPSATADFKCMQKTTSVPTESYSFTDVQSCGETCQPFTGALSAEVAESERSSFITSGQQREIALPAGQKGELQAWGQQMTIDHGWIFCESLNVPMKRSTHLLCFLYLSRVVRVHAVTKSMWTHVGEEQIRYCTKTGWQGGWILVIWYSYAIYTYGEKSRETYSILQLKYS